MTTLARMKRRGANEYTEYVISEFYVNKKRVTRKFFHLVSTYYFKKYLSGFYSREVKQTSGYLQIKYFGKKT